MSTCPFVTGSNLPGYTAICKSHLLTAPFCSWLLIVSWIICSWLMIYGHRAIAVPSCAVEGERPQLARRLVSCAVLHHDHRLPRFRQARSRERLQHSDRSGVAVGWVGHNH